MAEEFVQTIKLRVDDSEALRAIKNLEAKAKEIRFGFKMDPSLARNLGTARGYNGAALIREERHAAKATNALAVAFDSCRRSVEQFSIKFSKMSVPRVVGGGGSFSELSSYGKFRDAMMMLPGITQLFSPVIGMVKSAIATGFSTVQQNEKLQTDLGTLLGDDSKGAAFAERIRNYAGATPYSQNDLSGLAKGLVQYGASMEETEKYMRQVGDIAMGSSQSMQGLGLVLGQVRSQGKLTGQDLMQFVNAGFNPLSVISEATGKSMAELRDMMGKGAISFDMVAKAMEIATSEGGKFYKGAERGSKTLGGMISTLRDNFSQAMAKAWENNMDRVKGIFDTLVNFNWEPLIGMISSLVSALSWLADVFVDVVNWVNDLVAGFGEMGPVVAGVVATVIPLVSVFKTLGTVTGIVQPIVGSMVPALGGVGKAITPFIGKGGLWGILAAEIAILASSVIETVRQLRKESGRKNMQDLINDNAKNAAKARKEWQEAEEVARQNPNNEYAKRTAWAKRQEYEKYAKRLKQNWDEIDENGYSGNYMVGITSEQILQDLGIDIRKTRGGNSEGNGGEPGDVSRQLAEDLKRLANVQVNVKNTTNQTNNISADFKDIGSLIRENLDQILVSHLNFNSNVEAARAAVL